MTDHATSLASARARCDRFCVPEGRYRGTPLGDLSQPQLMWLAGSEHAPEGDVLNWSMTNITQRITNMLKKDISEAPAWLPQWALDQVRELRPPSPEAIDHVVVRTILKEELQKPPRGVSDEEFEAMCELVAIRQRAPWTADWAALELRRRAGAFA